MLLQLHDLGLRAYTRESPLWWDDTAIITVSLQFYQNGSLRNTYDVNTYIQRTFCPRASIDLRRFTAIPPFILPSCLAILRKSFALRPHHPQDR